VVTSLSAEEWGGQQLCEELYCARGEMENRIKEQLSLFSDQMSTATMRANELRLYLSAAAYVWETATGLKLPLLRWFPSASEVAVRNPG